MLPTLSRSEALGPANLKRQGCTRLCIKALFIGYLLSLNFSIGLSFSILFYISVFYLAVSDRKFSIAF